MYHGLRALTAVCVGDVGDVIAIYDTMLRKSPAVWSALSANPTDNSA